MDQNLNPHEIETQADSIVRAKFDELAAAGVDVRAMTEDEMIEAIHPLITAGEQRIVGMAGVMRMANVVIGEKIVETLRASGFNIHLPDIAPSVTAYLEYLAAEEAEQAA